MADDLEIVIRVIDQASSQLDAIRGKAEESSSGIAQAAKVGFGALGVAADVAVVASVKAAESFQTMVANIRGNTTMTAADAQQMGDAIKRMAVESGASLEQLGQAWMHVTNFGFQAADAQKIVTAAMESAVASGSNVGDTANTLAAAMKEFGISATDAGGAMDVLHVAAATGNMTLEDLVESGGKALSTAANMKVSLVDAAAALSTMTEHGFDAAQAATQLTGILTHIQNPSQAAQAEIKKLSETTGIDLTRDFGAGALSGRTLGQIFDDIAKATAGNTGEITRLIPALRGGQGAMILAGTGAQDYQQKIQQLTAAQENGHVSADAYAEKQKTLGNELDRLGAMVHVAAIDIGTALIPAISDAVAAVTPLISAITQWLDAHPQLSSAILVTVGVVGTLVGGLALLSFAFGPLLTVFGGFSALLTTTAALMTGSAGASTAAAVALDAQAGAAGVDAEAVNTLVAALLAQADVDGLVAESAMNAAAADAALAAAGGEAGAAMEAEGAAASFSLGPLGLVAAAAIGLGVAIKEVIIHLQDHIQQNQQWVASQDQASSAIDKQVAALRQQGATDTDVARIATQNAASANVAYQQAQIAVENYASAHGDLSSKQLSADATFKTLTQDAAVAQSVWRDWKGVADGANQSLAATAKAQTEMGTGADAARAKLELEAASASFDADAQTRLSDAIDKAAKGGAQSITFFDQLAQAHQFAGMSADAQQQALVELQDTIDNGKGKAKSAAQAQMDLDLAIQSMGGASLDASVQHQQLLDKLGMSKEAGKSAEGEFTTLIALLGNVQTSAQEAGDAIINMLKKPSQEELNAKADLAGYKDTQAQLQDQLSQMPPTLQHVAEAQKQVDDLWEKGQTGTKQYATALANRATVVSGAYQTEGQAATDAAASTQQQIDATGHLITQTQTHVTALSAHRDALAAGTAAGDANALSTNQQADAYNKALPIINGTATAQQTAATTTQQASDTVNAAYAATRDAHTDMATTVQTNTAQVQTANANVATATQTASDQMGQANAAAGQSFDQMNQGAQTAVTNMMQTVANGIMAVELLGVPAARGAGTAIGAALDQGIEAGVQAEAGNVAAAAANVVTQAVAAARAAAGNPQSPSPVTLELVGKPLGQGVEAGLNWAQQAVYDAGLRLGATALKGLHAGTHGGKGGKGGKEPLVDQLAAEIPADLASAITGNDTQVSAAIYEAVLNALHRAKDAAIGGSQELGDALTGALADEITATGQVPGVAYIRSLGNLFATAGSTVRGGSTDLANQAANVLATAITETGQIPSETFVKSITTMIGRGENTAIGGSQQLASDMMAYLGQYITDTGEIPGTALVRSLGDAWTHLEAAAGPAAQDVVSSFMATIEGTVHATGAPASEAFVKWFGQTMAHLAQSAGPAAAELFSTLTGQLEQLTGSEPTKAQGKEIANLAQLPQAQAQAVMNEISSYIQQNGEMPAAALIQMWEKTFNATGGYVSEGAANVAQQVTQVTAQTLGDQGVQLSAAEIHTLQSVLTRAEDPARGGSQQLGMMINQVLTQTITATGQAPSDALIRTVGQAITAAGNTAHGGSERLATLLTQTLATAIQATGAAPSDSMTKLLGDLYTRANSQAGVGSPALAANLNQQLATYITQTGDAPTQSLLDTLKRLFDAAGTEGGPDAGQLADLINKTFAAALADGGDVPAREVDKWLKPFEKKTKEKIKEIGTDMVTTLHGILDSAGFANFLAEQNAHAGGGGGAPPSPSTGVALYTPAYGIVGGEVGGVYYPNAAPSSAAAAPTTTQTTAPIPAGPVHVTVSVAGANPGSSLNVAVV